MVSIFVDADACPVKDETLKVGMRHRIKMIFVSNQWMRLPVHDLIQIQVVSTGPDEADNWIAESISQNDICITADIPLAHRVISKGGMVLSPTGKPMSEESIGSILATRDLMTHLRDSGQIEGGGNPSFKKQDRSNFLSALETMVQKALRL